MTNLTDMALEKAHAILNTECSPIGLMASPEGYPHVWARDSVARSDRSKVMTHSVLAVFAYCRRAVARDSHRPF